jgi:predicted AlkP superfamily pyrophosphatase or phosphodiesterase
MKRIVAVVAGAVVLAAGAAFLLRDDETPPPVEGAPTVEQMADRIGAPIMRLIHNGTLPGDSGGEVIFVPRPNFYLGPDVDLTNFGTDSPETFTSHPNPWAYLTRVPLIVHAPGHVEKGESYEPVELVDIAPTYAELLGLELDTDGSVLPGLGAWVDPPKLIFTVIIDGGGWNVLEEHPGAWDEIRAIADDGMLYRNALIGSTPAMTGAIHANIGTGVYPKTHGIPTNTYFVDGNPENLRVPTVGDAWDQEQDNVPIVGAVTVLSTQLGMLGHGAQMEGGDLDIGVYWDEIDHRFVAREDYYALPEYLRDTDFDTLERYEADMDLHDGTEDGMWFNEPIENVKEGLRRASTSAFARYEGDKVVELIRNEPLGEDDITDLFYVQMKSLDQAGHNWNMINPEVGDVLEVTSRQIARFKRELDAKVGAKEYMLVISADHGQQPLFSSTGTWMINSGELDRDLEKRFGVDLRVGTHYVNLYEEGADHEQIARFLATYTVGDNIAAGVPGAERVPRSLREQLIFAGAFPSTYAEQLTPAEIRSFGPSDYGQGELLVEAP